MVIYMIKRIIIIAVNALCLIAFFVCLGISSSIRTPLRSQQANIAWAGQSGDRFAQLSLFFPPASTFDVDGVMSLRSSIEKALTAASIDSAGRTLYKDAWSAETDVSLMSLRGSPTTAKAIAVGGDFFLFHPLTLRHGSYLSPNDVMKDRVVIDEELAWRLFGAVHVAGFELMLNNRPFIVAGVISRETDFATSKAYSYGAGLFMSFDALLDMTEGSAKIETYEIVLPNPITGFAHSMFEKESPNPNALLIENSARFNLGNTFSRIGEFGERSMRTDPLQLPYWENAARYAEDWLALILIISLIFLTFPFICAIIYTVILIRFLIKQSKSKIHSLIAKKDQRHYEQYLLEHGEDLEEYSLNDIISEVHDEIY